MGHGGWLSVGGTRCAVGGCGGHAQRVRHVFVRRFLLLAHCCTSLAHRLSVRSLFRTHSGSSICSSAFRLFGARAKLHTRSPDEVNFAWCVACRDYSPHQSSGPSLFPSECIRVNQPSADASFVTLRHSYLVAGSAGIVRYFIEMMDSLKPVAY